MPQTGAGDKPMLLKQSRDLVIDPEANYLFTNGSSLKVTGELRVEGSQHAQFDSAPDTSEAVVNVRDSQSKLTISSGNMVAQSLTGAGTLNVAGSVTLANASTIGNLSARELVLNSSLTVAGNLVANGVTINSLTSIPVLNIGGDLVSSTGVFSINVDSSQLADFGLKVGDSFTLVNVAGNFDGRLTINGSSSYIVVGDECFTITTQGGNIVVTSIERPAGPSYMGAVSSPNGMAGAAQLESVRNNVDPQAHRALYPDLANLMDYMDALIAQGRFAEADTLAASIAGAGITALGSASISAAISQLRGAANAVSNMGASGGSGGLASSVWFSSQMSRGSMKGNGSLPGFDLKGETFTLGWRKWINSELVVGAIASGGKGRVDSYEAGYVGNKSLSLFLSGYARYEKNNWLQSFVLMGGLSHMETTRRVVTPYGGYQADGKTMAYSVGAFYEVGHRFVINEDERFSWQPLVNISVLHNWIDGFTESGTDAALVVGAQHQTSVCLGSGARMEHALLIAPMKTKVQMHYHALAVLDVGQLRSEADVRLLHASQSSRIKGKRRDPLMGDVGTGAVIPLFGGSGDLYLDVWMQFQRDYHDWNASFSYRQVF